MCECSPNLLTIWCGKDGCQPLKYSAVDELIECQKVFNGQYEKYDKLLEFVKKVKGGECCNIYNCHSCEAFELLSQIGEE